MRLTSHLSISTKSPIRRFFHERFFAFIARLMKDANRHPHEIEPILPGEHHWAYSHVGMELSNRIRCSFVITPCHDMVAWHGAKFLLSVANQVEMHLKNTGAILEVPGLTHMEVIEIEAADITDVLSHTFQVIEAFFPVSRASFGENDTCRPLAKA